MRFFVDQDVYQVTVEVLKAWAESSFHHVEFSRNYPNPLEANLGKLVKAENG